MDRHADILPSAGQVGSEPPGSSPPHDTLRAGTDSDRVQQKARRVLSVPLAPGAFPRWN